MALRLSKTQARQYGIRTPKAATTTRQRYGGYASNWEREYAAYLAQEQLRGRIIHWVYEPVRFLLADKSTYKPDFLVQPNYGKLEVHEVKGFWRRDARTKIKIAARMFPMFRWLGIRKVNGLWDVEEFYS